MPGALPWRGDPRSRQPVPVRLRWFLAISSALLVVIGLTVVLDDALDNGGGAGDQVMDAGSTTTSTTIPGLDSDRGVIEVAGHVDEVHLETALLDEPRLPTPVTIESDRGFGNGGEVGGVTVAGKDSSIVWDGGRPFVLSSGPAFVLDRVTVDLVDGKVRCGLAGGNHGFGAGDYELDTPVAIGSAGIATPRDSVAFTAGRGARFDAHGDAALTLEGEGSHTFTGPGRVHLVGDLVVTTETGQQGAGQLDLGNGAYELTLSPTEGGGWTVSGRVQSLVVGGLALG